MGGDKGEGEIIGLFTPTSILHHQGAGGCLGEFQMPRALARGASLDMSIRWMLGAPGIGFWETVNSALSIFVLPSYTLKAPYRDG